MYSGKIRVVFIRFLVILAIWNGFFIICVEIKLYFEMNLNYNFNIEKRRGAAAGRTRIYIGVKQ